jgi:periplasmic divalent cation tolerance protein
MTGQADGGARIRSVRSDASRARLALVTAADETQAAAIARALIEERLAACVNLIPNIRSIYRWRGAVEDDREWLLLIKTTAAQYKKMERRILEMHSYETPEVIELAIAGGAAPYLRWLCETAAPVKLTRRPPRRG